MAKKQILGFQPARRLEQVDDEHPKRVQDCEHRQGSCDDSASRRESQAGWNFRKGQLPQGTKEVLRRANAFDRK